MSNFFEILGKYSTWQHVSVGCDKNTHHSYGPTYEKILSKLKSQDSPDILEIGISSGAFLQVMSEYIPHANIYGIDIMLDTVKFGKDNPSIKMFEINATTKNGPTIINKTYDLIIDDASHSPHDQIETFEIFAPYVKARGTYVIEDIQPNNDINRFKDVLKNIATNNNMEMEWLDLTNVKNHIDDILVIFTKNNL